MARTRESLPYRRNVAIVVVNREGKILACHRSDVAGAWQLPQGGIDDGESDEVAMRRELKEEIGTDQVEIIGRLPDPIRYEWPEHLFERGYRGQEQIYFLVRLREGAKIALHSHAEAEAEFDRFEWLGVDDFLARVHDFKASAYREALEKLRHDFSGIIAA